MNIKSPLCEMKFFSEKYKKKKFKKNSVELQERNDEFKYGMIINTDEYWYLSEEDRQKDYDMMVAKGKGRQKKIKEA